MTGRPCKMEGGTAARQSSYIEKLLDEGVGWAARGMRRVEEGHVQKWGQIAGLHLQDLRVGPKAVQAQRAPERDGKSGS